MIRIVSPLAGWATPLRSVPDPVFAECMLGDGIAVDPVEGRLVAPAAGMVASVHSAGHAVTLEVDGGPVLLIHIGLDTVGLNGEGFSPQVAAGQRVNEGDPLILFDLDLIARRARSLVTPVIVTNGDAFRIEPVAAEGPITRGRPLFNLVASATAVSAKAIPTAFTASKSLRLLLAHGLHARPAARLAKAASAFDAQAEIVAPNGTVASVRSPVAVLGLGLSHGAEIVVRASGQQAEQVVAALVDLLDGGMGELLPLSERTGGKPDEPMPVTLPAKLRGIAAVSGMVIGSAWRLKQADIAVVELGESADAESSALVAAQARVRSTLERDANGEGSGAEIAAAHLAMLDDPTLDESARRSIAAGKSAAFAWRQAIETAATPLRASKDARFAERLDDLVDLERRVLTELVGEHAQSSRPPEGAIVLAETIYPSQLQSLEGVGAVVTERGGATSHAAIIAAGIGLPMVVGLGPALSLIEDGTPLILRGDTLEISPGEEALSLARAEAEGRERRIAAARATASEHATTLDGTRIEVFANLGSVADMARAVEDGAEGCGLLRTEFLFLDRPTPPDELEQRDAYQSIADALGDRPLIVRTLDIGADKPAPWLPMDSEDNPALGLRGVRLQLARTDLLETQLRALLGVRAKDLRIMLPMITGLGEIRAVRAMLQELTTQMQAVQPSLGIMVETPAAALIASRLAEEAAFFSIGTNDLSQYTLARDRTNPAVAADLDGLDPSILRLIDETVRGGSKHGRPVGVCGGLAAVPEAIPILIGLGVTELSVPAAAIAETKLIVRSLDIQSCRALASEAVGAPDAAAVRALSSRFLEQ